MSVKQSQPHGIKRPVETRPYWNDNGPWKCVCRTPTHKRGQRFTQSQCQYCEPVKERP